MFHILFFSLPFFILIFKIISIDLDAGISFLVDISLYEGEDQLDEIDRRRKGDDAASPVAAGKSASAQDSKPKRKAKKASDEDTDFKKEIKIKVKQPKKPVADDEDAEPPRRRVEKRKSAENAKNAMDAFEFADSSEGEEEEEVMPKPKKRKSATAAVEKKTPSKTNETKVQKVIFKKNLLFYFKQWLRIHFILI